MRELSEQEIVRREKLESIREITNPYPDSYETNYTISEARLLDDGVKVIASDITSENIDNRAIIKECNIFNLDDPYSFFDKPDVLLHLLP